MLSEDDAKSSFAPLLASFQLKDRFYHAFEALGQPLKKSDFNEVFAKGDGLGGRVSQPVSDAVRLALLKDLVDGLVWCHLQGTPHLRLDSDTVRLHKTPPSQGRRFGEWRANLVGIGTGAQLATRKTPYQVGNESWAFNPPETLTGALIKGNLPGLYAWDSWSLGVLASMVCGGYTWSPFAAEADLADLTFSTQAAVALKIKRELGDFSGFLTKLNRDGDGFLFRYGWVVEMLVGLLKPDSSERLSAVQAREIMEAGLAQRLTAQTKDKKAKARAARAQQQGAQGGKAAELEGRVLSAGDMQKVKLAFEAFDVDGSGFIEPDEIVLAMGKMGLKVTAEQATLIITDADTTGKGTVDFTEFCIMAQELYLGAREGTPVDDLLSASAIFGGKVKSAEGEPFRSLEAMISIADKGLTEVVIERREGELATLKNYGEIVGFRNRADGDRWDVVVPGLDQQLPPGSRHRLSAVLGVVLIKGGNHKLVVALGGAQPDPTKVARDLEEFTEEYAKSHENVKSGKRIRYLELGDPFGRGAGTLDVEESLKGLEQGEKDDDDGPKPPSAIASAF